MKKRMVLCGKNRDMMRNSKAGKNAGGAVCTVLLLCAALLLTACAGENKTAEQTWQGEEWLAQRTKVDRRTKHDLRTEPADMEKTDRIDLDACESGRVILSGSDIWLSGSLEGQVVIDTEEDEVVHLYLDGVEITSPNGPALWVQEAAKVIVTLVSDTENVFADSPNYTDYEETPACLYSVCDLTVNGGGALHVFGYHEDGIRSKDRIKLLGGVLSVQAKGDGIRGSDGIYMQDASVSIESEKNGLRTANQGADERGVIEIDGGALSVIAGKNGICSAADVYVYRGQCSLRAVEETVKAEGTAYIAE